MKKILLSSLALSSLLYANSSVTYQYGVKDFTNSKTKKDGAVVQSFKLSNERSNHRFILGFQSDDVDREHSVTKAKLPSLDIEKYSAKYIYKLNKKIQLKTSYLKIVDNLAPTDKGKIYGIGGAYMIQKGLKANVDLYKSDYENFDVNQYDLSVSKAYKLEKFKLKATAIAKMIDIDGQKYGNYTFKDRDYFTAGIKLGGAYNSYFGGVGAFFGKRAFTVFDGGMKVQHHAMEQDKMYMLSLGKRFENIEVVGRYTFQNGKELPENQDDVDTKLLSLAVSYKF